MKLLFILLTYLRTCYGRTFRSRAALERWQQRQLKRHLSFLRRHSPFYRALGTHLKFEDLPLMDKAQMMASFDLLNTCKLQKEAAFKVALAAERSRDFTATLGGVTIGLSSGTSGNRGIFAVSAKEQAMWAGHLLAKVVPRALFPQKHRAALFLRANSNLYEATGKARIQFRFFDLLHSLEQHRDQLQSFQPTILVAPPSLLRKLAAMQESGIISIHPNRIYAVAEVLETFDATFISRAFQQDIHEIYQATEGFLGISCKAGHLHLNEDLVFIEKEFVDAERTRFVPIITDFRRRTQPIVRYRLNDILTINEEPCACGSVFTRLKAIEGRCDDMLCFFEASGALREVFPDFMRRAVITADAQILEYRVRQLALDRLVVEIKLPEGVDDGSCRQRIAAQIIDFCQEQMLVVPTIEFAPYRFEAVLVKLRRIMNEVHRAEWRDRVAPATS